MLLSIRTWHTGYTVILTCEACNMCSLTSRNIVIGILFQKGQVGCTGKESANGKLLQGIFNMIFNLNASH